jgi:hypothetical protein
MRDLARAPHALTQRNDLPDRWLSTTVRSDSREMKIDDGTGTMNDDQRYAAAWRSLRTRRWTLGLLVVACLPVVVGALRLFPEGPIQASIAGAWMASFAVSMIWLAAFRCPRCGRFFWWTWTRRNPFAQRCLHCGTASGSAPSDAPVQPATPAPPKTLASRL